MREDKKQRNLVNDILFSSMVIFHCSVEKQDHLWVPHYDIFISHRHPTGCQLASLLKVRLVPNAGVLSCPDARYHKNLRIVTMLGCSLNRSQRFALKSVEFTLTSVCEKSQYLCGVYACTCLSGSCNRRALDHGY